MKSQISVKPNTRKVRELLLTECELQAVVNMPSGVFRPYAGVSTAVLVFKKRPKPVELNDSVSSVWFYDLTADGFSLDDKRTPTEANDIPDLLAKWPKREEGPNSLRVPVAKIVENDLSFAVGRYRESTTLPPDHELPGKILKDIVGIEGEIKARAERLLMGFPR